MATINKDKLMDLIIRKKLNYSKLAEKSGVSISQISRIFKGNGKLRPDTIGKLSDALDIDYKELILNE